MTDTFYIAQTDYEAADRVIASLPLSPPPDREEIAACMARQRIQQEDRRGGSGRHAAKRRTGMKMKRRRLTAAERAVDDLVRRRRYELVPRGLRSDPWIEALGSLAVMVLWAALFLGLWVACGE